jgi:uncharacterized protein YbjT (DUF2867 family)
MILLVGARWNVGSLLVQELLALGQEVRLLVRNPEKAALLAQPGVEIVQGGFTSPAQVCAAMHGVDRVVLLPSPQRGLMELERSVIIAAHATGVRHLVKISASLVGPKLGLASARWQWHAEELVRSSGIPYTVLRPAFAMQSFFHFARSIRTEGAFHASLGNARVAMADTRDVAGVAARVLTGGDHAQRTYVLTGSEALTFSEAAECLSSAVRQRVRYVTVSPEEYRGRLLVAGVPSWEAEDTQRAYELMEEDWDSELTEEVSTLLGRPPRTFSQFARDHALLFTRQPLASPAALSAAGFAPSADWRPAALHTA